MKTKYCQRGIWLKRESDNQITLMKAPCKKWSCPICGEINTGRWRTRLQHGFRVLGGDWQFVTFTAHENWRGRDASIKNIRRNSDKLWKRYQRMARKRYGRTFHYARVFEPHQDGSLHVHAFINADYRLYQYQNMRASKSENRPARKTPLKPRRWLKNNARYCGMGFQSDVQKISNPAKATYYITKYISKNLNSNQFPDGTRRIQTSTEFPKPDWWDRDDSGDSWQPILNGIKTLDVLRHLRAGKPIFFVNESRSVSLVDIDPYFDDWMPDDLLREDL